MPMLAWGVGRLYRHAECSVDSGIHAGCQDLRLGIGKSGRSASAEVCSQTYRGRHANFTAYACILLQRLPSAPALVTQHENLQSSAMLSRYIGSASEY